MQHFKKLENGTYQVIGYHDRDFRLLRYTPRSNEFEKGLKYRLCEFWVFTAEPAMGWKEEQRVTEISKHSSIKEAEKYLRWLEAIK